MTAQAPIDEDELLDRARNYETRAVEQLLAMHYARVQRFARALTGRDDVSRGVVRFVIHQALRLLPTFAREGAPARWFNHHTVLTTRRAGNYPPSAANDVLIINAPPTTPAYVAFITAIRKLDIQQREAYLLTTAEQFDLRNTAIAMDCSTEAAANHLKAAEQTLKSIAGADYDTQVSKLRQAYQSLTPADALQLPAIQKYARRFLWPRRLKRFIRFFIPISIIAALIYAWRHGWLHWIPGL